jgi:hypothetical protein
MTNITSTLNNRQLKRWKNALKQVAKLNKYIKKDFLVIDDTNRNDGPILRPFIIRDYDGISSIGILDGNAFYCYGDNDVTYDNGIMHTSMEDFNKQFNNLSVYSKVAI